MSFSTLGQKSLNLACNLFAGLGLVLFFSQPLSDDNKSGESFIQIRQQIWTQNILSGKTASYDASLVSVPESVPASDSIIVGSIAPSPLLENKSVSIHFVSRSRNVSAHLGKDKTPRDGIGDEAILDEGEVWSPYSAPADNRAVTLNWSGSVWSMASLFENPDKSHLPQHVFQKQKRARMDVASAKAFVLPRKAKRHVARKPVQIASNAGRKTIESGTAQGGDKYAVLDSNALGYASTPQDNLQAPFNAVLTGTGSTDAQAEAMPEAQTAIAPLVTLPRARPRLASLSQTVKKPIDLSKKALKPAESPKSAKIKTELHLASLSKETKKKGKKKSPFARWFNFSAPKKAKISTKGEHAWVSNPLPKSSFTKTQKTCLANAIYFESRSESEKGQIAVGQVVMNRVKNPAYPNTICGVVYQNKNKRNACQFSFACDGIPDRVNSRTAWNKAWKLAEKVVKQEVWLKDVGSSTHYHATYVHPKWAKYMQRRQKIGLHIFYKTYGGGWM